MRNTIAIILGAFIFMAVPFASYGSGDATTTKTEVISEPGVMDLQIAVAATVPSVFDQFTNFNYVAGPNLETRVIGDVHLHALHSRWYIDIQPHFTHSMINLNTLIDQNRPVHFIPLVAYNILC